MNAEYVSDPGQMSTKSKTEYLYPHKMVYILKKCCWR